MIVITGINGFIAKHLYNHLLKTHSKEEIVGTTKEESSKITDILEKYAPEYIYHAGAEIYNNDKMFESNLLLTYQILEYCRKAPNLKKCILLGSSSEYGRKRSPMSETDSLEPRTIYEGTKAACTMLAQSYSSTYNIPILVIRPFTIYGPCEKPNKFLQVLFRKKLNGDKTISVSEGVHDYVYIDDFIQGMFEIVKKNTHTFDIVNIGSGTQLTNIEVVHTFEKVTEYKFDTYSKMDSKPYDSDMWVSNVDKLHHYYVPTISLEDGIRHIMNTFDSHLCNT